ncbi:hypothetical protein [Naasia aerilata]|uniref:hypothetical protein n=1 Tax=Naasia aerilata TaxID=1162966 RepID=UPI002573FFC4|nr:hypothetical protein [Naasia aerilata]
MNPYKSALGWMTVAGLLLGPLAIAAGFAAAQSVALQELPLLLLLVPLGYVLAAVGGTSLFAWLIVGALLYAAPSRKTTHTGQFERVG